MNSSLSVPNSSRLTALHENCPSAPRARRGANHNECPCFMPLALGWLVMQLELTRMPRGAMWWTPDSLSAALGT